MNDGNIMTPATDAALADRINEEHRLAFGKAREALEHARPAGLLLLEAKSTLKHGEWLPWLKANCNFTPRTAQGYIRLAKHWDELKCETVSYFTLRGTLGALRVRCKKYEHEQAEMERADYRRTESDARSARMGLWRDPDPVPPWEFRRNRTAYVLGSPESVPMNAILAIHPYKHQGIWVFDDPAVGLTREPFISGADEIIERMVRGIPNAERGFTLVFSSQPFPGYEVEFEWSRADMSGNWYRSPALGMEGWLCSALLKYFEAPPRTIYAQFRAKAAKASR